MGRDAVYAPTSVRARKRVCSSPEAKKATAPPTQESWSSQSTTKPVLPNLQIAQSDIERQDVKLRAEVALANKDKFCTLPQLSSLELKEMTVEKLLQELANTEELLQINAERQSKLVTGRLRKSKVKLLRHSDHKASFRRGPIPSPRWPDLVPSSTLPRISDNSSPPLRKCMSSPQLVGRRSEFVPEELFSWMSSINSPNRSLSTLKRFLSPIPQAMRKSPRSVLPSEEQNVLADDVDDEHQEISWHYVAILGAQTSAGATQIEVIALKDQASVDKDLDTYSIQSGDELLIQDEYYRVASKVADQQIELSSGLTKDLSPRTEIKKLDIVPQAVDNNSNSGKSKAFIEAVEMLKATEIVALTNATCQETASILLPSDDRERQKKLLDLYMNSSVYSNINKALLDNSSSDLRKYGSYIFELKEIFRSGQENSVVEPFANGIVWRDCKLPEDDLQSYVDTFCKSQLFCWSSFTSMSCSPERDATGNLTFEIQCWKNSKPQDDAYCPCTVDAHRDVILWPPHCQFRFVNAKTLQEKCILEFETLDSPSVWELLEQEDWLGFEKWATDNPDKVDTASRKFSIISAVARHMTKEPDFGEPDPFKICILCGADVNEVDKVTKDTPALTIAQKQAEFLSSGGSDFKGVLLELVKNGADVHSKNEFGISVADLLPGFDFPSPQNDSVSTATRPESRSSIRSRLSRKLTFFQEPENVAEEDVKSHYLKEMRIKRAETLKSRSSQGSPQRRKSADDLYVEDAAKARSLEIDRCLVLSSWNRLSSGGELATDEIVQLLAMAGHCNGEQRWIDEVMAEHYGGEASLDSCDLMDFIGYYEQKFLAYITEEFKKADRDDSGSLSAAEISRLLRMTGTTPTPGIVDELMWEITGVDNGLTELSLEEFLKLHDLMKDRAGFSRSEVMEMQSLFERYDRSGDGRIDANELSAALSWSGLGNDKAMVSQLMAEVESYPEKSVNQKEFLMLMRKRREHEIQTLRAAFGDSDEDVSGSMDAMELPHVFEKLGFMAASPEIVSQCAKKCGIELSAGRDCVFEDIYILLEEFRHQEGFLDHELDEIKDCFDRYDVDKCGYIGGVQLGNAIRWLGYPQTMEQLQEHMAEFDIDETGTVDFPEFLKIMRQYREQEATLVRRHFREKDKDESGTLSESELKMVLLFLGHSPAVSELKTLYKEICGDGEMDLWQLDTLVRRYRTQARERFRRNRGFTEREVKKLQAKFQQYQPDSEDALEKRHLADLIADLFPDSGRDAATHHKAAQILHEVDQDGDGKLEFDEYLQLMRLIQDAADLQKIEKEQTAVQATGFLREEVAEFRKVFQVFDSDASGEMSFDEFISLIATLVPVQDTNMSRELQNMLKDIDKDGNRSLDFPEFLRIMRRVQDDNWGEVNQRAAEKVAENEAIDAGVTSTTAQVPNRAEDAPEMQALEKDEDEAEQEEEDDLVVELEHLMIEPLRRYAKIYGASKAEMIEAESVKKARGHYVELIISKRRHLKKLSVEQLRDRAQMLGITPDELDKAADVINEHAALRKLVMETIRSRIHDSDEDDKDNVAS